MIRDDAGLRAGLPSPTTSRPALDVTIQAQILDLLNSSCSAGRHGPALIITHDLGGLRRHDGPQVALMYAGQIVERWRARPEFFAAT